MIQLRNFKKRTGKMEGNIKERNKSGKEAKERKANT
jgi:hypothetical protein